LGKPVVTGSVGFVVVVIRERVANGTALRATARRDEHGRNSDSPEATQDMKNIGEDTLGWK